MLMKRIDEIKVISKRIKQKQLFIFYGYCVLLEQF